MASAEHHPVFADEDLDEEDDDDESEEDDGLPTHLSKSSHPDLHLNNNNTTSSSNPAAKHKVTIAFAGVRNSIPAAAAAAAAVKQPVPLSVVPMDSTPDPKRPKIETVTIDDEEKVKPLPILDERRLFQRLWTDEDEIELLQGFLEYTSQRGFVVGNSSSSHHHDTSLFYDQIKSKLQIDFNKNQLVDKLRRLKKKYRNVVSKIGTGKVQPFKSTHDEATFAISRQIWRADGVKYGAGGGFEDEEEEETNLNQTPNNGIDPNSAEKKRSANSRKRPRSMKVKENEMPQFHHQQQPQRQHSDSDPTATKLDFGSSKMEEKWRNQRILELEVYSKRLELVQDQIKSALTGLRSMGSSVHL